MITIYRIPAVTNALLLGRCGQARVGVARPGWVWPGLGGCGQARVGVARPGWVWPALGGCGQAWVGVARPG